MHKLRDLPETLLRSPILWGTLASAGFFALVHAELLGPRFFQRYCAGHPVEYVETILFFVGLAVLLIKASETAIEHGRLGRPLLGPIPPGGQGPAETDNLLTRLHTASAGRRNDRLVCRLHDGLEYVGRRGSAESLDQHLKHLADLEADHAHASYALHRLIVWAIPILGFLGTVVGITMAIASLRVDALEASMIEVTAGLGVAFDTTALALALSIILMFTQHYVDRAESSLLAEVDRRADAELLGRFPAISASPEGQVAAFRQVTEAMAGSFDQLMRRQAELWKASMESARDRWGQTAEVAGHQLQVALSAALVDTLRTHAQQMAAAEESAAEKNRRHWSDVQRSLAHAAEGLAMPAAGSFHAEGPRRTGNAA